jgi:pimeloyl-ACP methyl ester carboxylesterase
MEIGRRQGAQGARPGRPTLVFLHGAGGSSQSWQGLLSALGRRVNALALDLPGHGQTPGPGLTSVAAYADWLAQALDFLGPDLGPVILAGHSMGGAIAQAYALARPGRLAGLALLGTGARLPVNPKILGGLLADFERTVGLVIKWCFFIDNPRLREESLTLMKAAGPATLHGDFRACSTFDLTADLPRLSLPTLVLTGQEDKMTTPAMAQELAGLIPGARLSLIPQAGHLVMLEQPQPVIATVGEFTAGLSLA